MMRLGDTPMSEDIIRRGAKQTCMELKRTKSGWQMLDTTAEIDMSQKEEGEKRRVAE
jgi:hypothetical protein